MLPGRVGGAYVGVRRHNEIFNVVEMIPLHLHFVVSGNGATRGKPTGECFACLLQVDTVALEAHDTGYELALLALDDRDLDARWLRCLQIRNRRHATDDTQQTGVDKQAFTDQVKVLHCIAQPRRDCT